MYVHSHRSFEPGEASTAHVARQHMRRMPFSARIWDKVQPWVHPQCDRVARCSPAQSAKTARLIMQQHSAARAQAEALLRRPESVLTGLNVCLSLARAVAVGRRAADT